MFPDQAPSPSRPEQVTPLGIFLVEIHRVDDAVGSKAAKIAAQPPILIVAEGVCLSAPSLSRGVWVPAFAGTTRGPHKRIRDRSDVPRPGSVAISPGAGHAARDISRRDTPRRRRGRFG